MAQNAVEKITVEHLLQCIVHDLGPQEAAESGAAKGLVGVDKEIMKYGLVNRRAKTAYKKDERFLIVVPGKLLLFKGMDIVGKHVRFVTSLFGASTRLVYGQLEFEVIVPDSKSLNLLTLSAEELTGWIGAIEKSSLFANEGPGDSGRKNLQNSRAERRRDPAYKNQEDPGYVGRGKSEPSSRDTGTDNFDAAMQKGFYMSRSKEIKDPEYVGRRTSEPSSRDTRRDNFDTASQQGFYTNTSKVPEGHDLRRGSNRHKGESGYIERDQHRERDQRNQAPGEYAGNRVESRGFTESLKQDNDEESQGIFERHEERSAGKQVVSYAQPRIDRGNAEYLPGSTRGNNTWEGNCGPSVEPGNANEKSCMNKARHRSSTHSASVSAQLNQQLPPRASLRNPMDSSKDEQQKVFFYMDIYRRGLIDSSTQTK